MRPDADSLSVQMSCAPSQHSAPLSPLLLSRAPAWLTPSQSQAPCSPLISATSDSDTSPPASPPPPHDAAALEHAARVARFVRRARLFARAKADAVRVSNLSEAEQERIWTQRYTAILTPADQRATQQQQRRLRRLGKRTIKKRALARLHKQLG